MLGGGGGGPVPGAPSAPGAPGAPGAPAGAAASGPGADLNMKPSEDYIYKMGTCL